MASTVHVICHMTRFCKMADEGSKDSSKDEFVFSRQEYDKLCELAKNGDTDGIRNMLDSVSDENKARFNHLTFCPRPQLHLPTPLVLAAQYGKGEVVKYLLENYGHVINTDQLATIVSRTTKKNVHHATALWAACTGGHLEIAKILVEHGADVNRTTLTRSTPLRGASFHGYILVMSFLLEHGANINTPNCIGQSPLCIAAMRGEVEAVRYLLERNADVTQTTINGYTVMHLAAAKGKVAVVQLLLDHGVPPMFVEADPYKPAYIPCPLFLAASTGNDETVQLLVNRDDCPVSCKADAYLLLAAMKCELKVRLRPAANTDIYDEWRKGLAIKQAHNVKTVVVPPRPEFRNMTEITTEGELTAVWHTFQFAHLDAFFQALLIRERCMGFSDQGLIYFLLRRGSYFCRYGRFAEAELLWAQSMKMEVEVCEAEIKHTEYGHCEGILRDLEKDLSVYADGVWRMTEDEERNYQPLFGQYITYGMQELCILSRLDSKADTEIISNELILGLVLYLFLLWLTYDERQASSKGVEPMISKDCETLGLMFVSNFLYQPSGSTLLHLALTNFKISDEANKKHVLSRCNDLRPLINALISWGADKVIDQPDRAGCRPIHLAMQLSDNNILEEDLVYVLVDNGVHLDAVNTDGESAFEMDCSSESLSTLYSVGALPLSCIAARYIVRHHIPYETKLPSHVISLVRLHDRRYVDTLDYQSYS